MITLQECLEKKYPTKEERAKAKEIDIYKNSAERESKLEKGELNLSDFKSIENAIIANGYLTNLNVSGCTNLVKLNFSHNDLASVDFLNHLPNPESLEVLVIFNNNIRPTDIS